MAAFEVLALDTATPQIRAPGASDTYTFPRAVELPLGTANGVLYLNGSKVVTSGSGLVFDASGNLGLGVTPSAWGVIGTALQVKQASLVSESNDQLYLTANAFFDGSWKYIASDIATQYYQASGAHVWRTAASGTAGNAISFTQAMTLDASGNLVLGGTPNAWILATAAQVGFGAALSSRAAGSTASDMTHAAYWNGTNWLYQSSSVGAARYEMTGANSGSTHAWFVSAGGTAGNAISFTRALTLDANRNLALNTTSVGTSAAGVLSIGNGTEPSTGPADTVQVYSVDLSAGNTIPAVYCEGSGVTGAGITNVTVTHKIAIKVNGTVYYLLATTNAT